MAETEKPGTDVVMVEVPAQLIAALHQAISHAGGGAGREFVAGMPDEAPAQAIAMLYQAASHATGLALQNAVQNQQVLNQISSAVVSKAVQLIMAVGETSRTMSQAATGPAAGEAPAMLMGTVYQEMAHSTGILFENAVAAQQQQDSLQQAAANQGVMQIYSLDTVADAATARPARLHDDTD